MKSVNNSIIPDDDFAQIIILELGHYSSTLRKLAQALGVLN
ncbi:MAG TPA: hypothetical protein VGD61_24760 [Pyrinomonadaceae bacterium]